MRTQGVNTMNNSIANLRRLATIPALLAGLLLCVAPSYAQAKQPNVVW
jgi:hypothetical protein